MVTEVSNLNNHENNSDDNGQYLQSRPQINPLKTNVRLLYLKTQSLPRCKHFSSRL